MNLSKLRIDRLLPVLINRTVIFFFLMCILTLILYVAGTSQNFIDSTLLALLRFYQVIGTFLITSSIFGVVMELVRAIRLKKGRYALRAAAYFLLTIFGIASMLLVLFVITISQGNY